MTDIPEAFGGNPATIQQEMSPSIGALAAALAAAQGEITGAAKGSENPFFKSRYADLAACWDACREPLSENKLAVIQTTAADPDHVSVITTLAHESGEWIRGTLVMTPEKTGPQALGACLTYARRYALAAMVGLAQVDDDAESATFRMSKIAVTKAIKALVDRFDADDGPGYLQVWDEYTDEEKKFIWAEMDRVRRSELDAFGKAARKAENDQDAPEPQTVDL